MQSRKSLGPEHPQKYFESLAEQGTKELENIRLEITEQYGDGTRRDSRTWGAQQAAELIGRSTPWLRDNDPDAPKNEAGHGRWTLERINEIRDRIGTRLKRPAGAEPLVIAFSKFKGGVGNTTNCAHAAHYFAIQGLRVLAVDFDPQSSLTQVLGGLVPDAHIYEEDLPNEALLRDLDGLKHCIRKTYFHNVHLVPSNSMLQDLELELSRQMMSGEESTVDVKDRLSAALEPIKHHYDIILIDCAPAMGMLTMNALAASDAIINPLKPSMFDRASFVMFTTSLASFYDYCSDKRLKYHRVLISQFVDVKNNHIEEQHIRGLYGDAVLSSKIMSNAEISNATGRLSTVYSLERPIGGRDTSKRALASLNSVYGEMLNDIKEIWKLEAVDHE